MARMLRDSALRLHRRGKISKHQRTVRKHEDTQRLFATAEQRQEAVRLAALGLLYRIT